MDEYDELMGRIAKMLFLMADAVRCIPRKGTLAGDHPKMWRWIGEFSENYNTGAGVPPSPPTNNPPLPAANPMLAAMWRQAQQQQGA